MRVCGQGHSDSFVSTEGNWQGAEGGQGSSQQLSLRGWPSFRPAPLREMLLSRLWLSCLRVCSEYDS